MNQNATLIELEAGRSGAESDVGASDLRKSSRGGVSLSPISGRKFKVPDSLYNLYLDSADGKPYYHRQPLCPGDRLVIKGVSVEKVWELGFDLSEILRWYLKRRLHRVAEEYRGK